LKRQSDNAYVLDRHPVGEADLIVTLLAEGHGKVRAVAPAGRSSRRRFGGLLEPMTRVRVTWLEQAGRELHRIESIEGLRSFAEMQAEPVTQAACAVLAEISLAFAHEGQADPPAYRLLGAVLDALERGGEPGVLIPYFEYWTLRIHGLLPDLGACAGCGCELTANSPARVSRRAGVLCANCARSAGRASAAFGPADRRFLDDAGRLPPDRMRPEQRPRPSRALAVLLRGTLEDFAERSFQTYRHLIVAETAAAGEGR
jgi:DNA repair protein RecO (recombination protein O)